MPKKAPTVTENKILPRSATRRDPLLAGWMEPLVVTGGIMDPLGLGKVLVGAMNAEVEEAVLVHATTEGVE